MQPAASTFDPERRHGPRFRVHRGQLRSHGLEARLVDFSRAGLGLRTHTALRVGATYRFRLFGGRGRPVAATVRWCWLRATHRRPNGEVLPVFHAGLLLDESSRHRLPLAFAASEPRIARRPPPQKGDR